MPSLERILGRAAGAALPSFLVLCGLATPALGSVDTADRYLQWCQNNLRGDVPAKADKHCGLYARDAGAVGLNVFARAEIEAAVDEDRVLRALDAGYAPDASVLADNYLDWFGNNTRQGDATKADKHWKMYVGAAKAAGLAVHAREYVEAESREGRDVRASSAGTPTSAPPNWDYAYRDNWDRDKKPLNGEATPYVKSVAEKMARDLVGSGFKQLQHYMSRNYMGHDRPTKSGGKRVYMRHLGFDVGKRIGAPVKALTNGKVVATIGTVKDPNTPAVIVKEDGAERWWVYGHITHGVKRGQRVAKGKVLGKMVDPQGQWDPHVHVTVFTSGWPLPRKVRPNFGWGRAKAADERRTIGLALKYSMHPLEGYARVNGLD